MAAEQRVGERLCSNGCGASISHMRADTKWCASCKVLRDQEKKREHNRKRAERARDLTRVRTETRSLRPRQIVVDFRSEPKREPRVPICQVCCGMPWARTPDRVSEGRMGYEQPVTGDSGLCRGCGEAWAPEPEPDRLEPLQSSAGTLAAYGELHSTNYLNGYARPQKKGKP